MANPRKPGSPNEGDSLPPQKPAAHAGRQPDRFDDDDLVLDDLSERPAVPVALPGLRSKDRPEFDPPVERGKPANPVPGPGAGAGADATAPPARPAPPPSYSPKPRPQEAQDDHFEAVTSRSFESNPVKERAAALPEAKEEDIFESYDSVRGESGQDLPPELKVAAVKSGSPAVVPKVKEEEIEEFIARTTAPERPPGTPERVRKPYNAVEKVSLLAGGVLLLFLCSWLLHAAASEAGEPPRKADGYPDTPMKGSVATISEASSHWRKLRPTDRVQQMFTTLPSPAVQMPEIIPTVSFAIDPAGSKDGFVRFIFKDSEGKSRGDSRVIQIKDGKLVDLDRGEIIKSSTEASVYCSAGLQDIHTFNSYTGDIVPRWAVEVSESASYEAVDKDWQVLGFFEVRNELEQ